MPQPVAWDSAARERESTTRLESHVCGDSHPLTRWPPSRRLPAARVVGEVVDRHDAIRIHGGVGEEVFVEVVTGHKRGVLASADELNHGLPCEMERRRIHVVDVKGHGGRVRDLVLLATDDGRRPKTL